MRHATGGAARSQRRLLRHEATDSRQRALTDLSCLMAPEVNAVASGVDDRELAIWRKLTPNRVGQYFGESVWGVASGSDVLKAGSKGLVQ